MVRTIHIKVLDSSDVVMVRLCDGGRESSGPLWPDLSCTLLYRSV